MFSFLLRKAGYGLLVLLGVVTVVFFLFNLTPGDPVRALVGESASEETVQNMRRKFDLDLPIGQRFALYLNDLSPLSLHNPAVAESRIYLDPDKYSYTKLIALSTNRALVAKWPYLKRSFKTDKNVSEILGEVIPGTVVLAVVSIALALLLGLLMGIVAALKKDTAYDRIMLFVSALGMAGPSFFVAIIVAWLGAIVWRHEVLLPTFPLVATVIYFSVKFYLKKRKAQVRWLNIVSLLVACSYVVWIIVPFPYRPFEHFLHLPGTGLNMTGSLYDVDVWQGRHLSLQNMILPVITLMVRPLSVIVQLTRSSLLDVLQQDYIRTARAKGLSEWQVVLRHALRNALNPVITAVSGWFASLLAGAVFVEFVFGWKGLGQQMFTAIEAQDLPVVMGGVIVIATAFVLINILVDVLYGWIDPRVRLG
ncbi:MAG: ABC transporter permease [Flavobacteriales bacterium]